MEKLLGRVERCQQRNLPILVPLLLIEGLSMEIDRRQALNRGLITAANKRQNIWAYGGESEAHSYSDKEKSGDPPEDDDLVELTREFTKLLALFRVLGTELREALYATSLLQTMHQMYLDGLKPSEQAQVYKMWHELHERLLLVESQMRQYATSSSDDQAEVQASIQVVRKRSNP